MVAAGRAQMVCAAVRFDHPAALELIRLLPRPLYVEASGSPQLDWLQSTLRLMAAEAGQLRPGVRRSSPGSATCS